MRMTDEQRALAESNMGLVGRVIKCHVHNVNGIGIYSCDDLFQIGYIGLCKAAMTYADRGSSFDKYACIVIRNEIFHALEYATVRRTRETFLADGRELVHLDQPEDASLRMALQQLRGQLTGVAQKGLDALLLLAEGYSSVEIAAMHGTTANNVTAWISRARKQLRSNAGIACLAQKGE